MRIIPNQSEKRFVSRLMNNGESVLIQTNPKPNFELESIRIEIVRLLLQIESD